VKLAEVVVLAASVVAEDSAEEVSEVVVEGAGNSSPEQIRLSLEL